MVYMTDRHVGMCYMTDRHVTCGHVLYDRHTSGRPAELCEEIEVKQRQKVQLKPRLYTFRSVKNTSNNIRFLISRKVCGADECVLCHQNRGVQF